MNKIAKTTMILMIVTMISKIFGFARELVLTYTYGAGITSDVYITSMSIPTTLFASIATAISTVFIPLFCEIDKEEGRKSALKFTNNIFNVVVILGLLLAIATFIFAEPVVKLFAMNFTGEKLKLTVEFTKIMIFGVIFIGLSNIMTSWLQINNEFTIPGIIAYPFNICIITGIVLSTKLSLNSMAIGTLIGMASQFLIQLPFAIKKGYKYKPYINLKDKYLKKMLPMIMPVFIGVGVSQLNMIVDKSLASTLGDGFITILNSANRLNQFVLGLFITTIASVVYPMLSRLSNEEDKTIFSKSVSQSINSVLLLIIPISVGAMVFAEPVVRIVFERGAFDQESTKMTAIALSCYSIGMVGFGIREILNKVFYSIQDTKTPMINGTMEVLLNIILNVSFIKILGYKGLAMATSISSILTTVLLFTSLKKRIDNFKSNTVIETLTNSIISSIFMGLISYFIYKGLINMLGSSLLIESVLLFISVASGALVYAISIILLKVEEVNTIVENLKVKFNINNKILKRR